MRAGDGNIDKMKLERFTLFSLAAVVLSLEPAYCQDAPPPRGVNTALVDSLTSTNREVRRDAAVNLDRERMQLVEELVAILNGTNSAKVKVDAAIVLGEYRAPEAVPTLVQHLDWDDAARGGYFNGLVHREEVEEKTAPVTAALKKIGQPAIPALLTKIVGTDEAHIAEKCLKIIRDIEGGDVTQYRLQGLFAKETDEKKKARLESALEALRKLEAEDNALRLKQGK